ncbi:unnamed protein product [Closterium sp. NIES-54]
MRKRRSMQFLNLLQSGTVASKEGAAAALFTLSVSESLLMEVRGSGAVPLLLDVLKTGSTRGRKDSALVLFNVSRDAEGALELVEAGAVEVLLEVLAYKESGLEEKAMAVLANICRLKEGRARLVTADGNGWVSGGSSGGSGNGGSGGSGRNGATGGGVGDAIAVLVAVVASGSPRAQEDSIMTLLLLATGGHLRGGGEGDGGDGNGEEDGEELGRRMVEEGVLPALEELLQSDVCSGRAKAKAQALVDVLEADEANERLFCANSHG